MKISVGIKPRKKFVVAAIAAVFVISLVGSGSWPFPNFGTTDSGTPESITIGNLPLVYSALIYIAEDQGLFAENGLNVTIRDYSTGAASIESMENGEANISLSPESAIIIEAFQKENISVIGSIDKYETVFLIGRKDHGIENTSDLKGKKIGVPWETMDFYLGRFLTLHDISRQDIDIVRVLPSEAVKAITNGSVDAIILPRDYVDPVKKQLGINFIIWKAQSGQLGYSVMACRDDWAAGHLEQINRLLKSLAQAEQYSIDHPDAAEAIVQKRLNYSDAYMATTWPDHRFSLSLDQSLVTAMEDEGRWMIENNLTTEKKIPDFRDYIYTKGLMEVNPEAVNVIG
jgi:ABC-type nitrate/sulfonate/bicarbonate transport system substrate-binding protein